MEIEQLGPYKIGRKLGRGGMGTVYAATLVDSGESAAVKLLSATHAHDEGFRDRFKAEIETLRKLSHPNIVRLYGFGEQGDQLFYSMELVEGRSLEDEIQNRRRFTWREVCDFAVQTCRALKHAHDRGVIHRDIKPANLLITPEGQIKLSDFGIAKLFGNTGMTAVGGVLGTVEYMAPEQTDGRPVTPRSDLYSLGGVMYTLLAGRPPFKASTVVEMLRLQRYAEPDPVRCYAPDAPEELQTLLAELLVKDPDKRIATAVVLSRRLESMRHGLSLRADPSLTSPTQAGTVIPGQPPQGPPVSVSSATMTAPGIPVSPPDATQGDEEYELSVAGPPGDAEAAARHARALSVTAELVSSTATDEQAGEPGLDRLEKRTSSRFVAVAADEGRGHEAAPVGQGHLAKVQTALLAIAVVALIGGTWFLMQPPSADKLFNRIEQAAAAGDINSLRNAAPDIKSFLVHYANDPRAAAVARYNEEIDLFVKSRQAEVRGRTAIGTEAVSPLERAYQEAMNFAKLDPDAAVERFAAIVDLYGGDEKLTADDGDILKLAGKQLENLRAGLEQRTVDEKRLLMERLDAADRLETSDPAAARAIRKAVVKLYAAKPWAAAAVERAQASLAARTAAGNPTAP